MTLTQTPSPPTRGSPPRRHVNPRTVVRLHGEHDSSTATALAEQLARAISLNDADLVVDLRDVQFMDASTIGVLMGALEFLGPRGRSLTLRSLSSCARRLIGVCDLQELVDPDEVDEALPIRGGAVALATWVAVPVPRRSSLGVTRAVSIVAHPANG